MRKIFQTIGLFSLLFFSFFLTDKTAMVIKDMDDIMVTIRDNKDNYKINSIDAVIKGDTIIPGISKREVNINASYQRMKEYGKYNSDFYVYKYSLPKISIQNNKDKYIINGNYKKRMVSLNFVLDDNYFSDVLNVLEQKEVKATFFINEKFLSNNLDLVYNLILKGYNFGVIDYSNTNFDWFNTIITKVGKQDNMYCYYKNKDTISKCLKVGGFTIKGLDIKNNYYSKVVNKLNSGAILNFNVDLELINDLDNIINYILKKGYTIENLSNHINEQYLEKNIDVCYIYNR